MHAGSSDCLLNWVLSCGSEILRRSKRSEVKKQKFDREDARLLLEAVAENNFPQDSVPGPENRDLRQLSGTSSVGADAHPDHE